MEDLNNKTYLRLEQNNVDDLAVMILGLIKQEAEHPICYLEIKTILDRAAELIDLNTYLK